MLIVVLQVPSPAAFCYMEEFPSTCRTFDDMRNGSLEPKTYFGVHGNFLE